MRFFLFALLLAIGTPGNANNNDRFHRLMDPLVGTWSVTIFEHLPDGSLMFELRQTRRVKQALGGRFLEEASFDSDQANGELPHGMALFSYDPARDVVLQHAFLHNYPGLRFSAEAKLADDGASAADTIVTPREPGFRTSRRLRFYWIGPNEFHYEAWARDGAGPEFLNEEIVYKRVL